MAEITIKCPHCQNDVTIQEEWNGLELVCPICQQNFVAQIPPAINMIQPVQAPQMPSAPVKPMAIS